MHSACLISLNKGFDLKILTCKNIDLEETRLYRFNDPVTQIKLGNSETGGPPCKRTPTRNIAG